MKKLICVVAALVLTGCGDAFSAIKCMEAAQKAFPDYEVVTVPDKKFTFLAKSPTGEIWYVEALSLFSPEPSAKVRVFKAEK